MFPNFAKFQASSNFINSVRIKFFRELHAELYVAKSGLKLSLQAARQSRSNPVVDGGLYSRRNYRYGVTIGYFIGEVIPKEQFLINVEIAIQLQCYPIKFSIRFRLQCPREARVLQTIEKQQSVWQCYLSA